MSVCVNVYVPVYERVLPSFFAVVIWFMLDDDVDDEDDDVDWVMKMMTMMTLC